MRPILTCAAAAAVALSAAAVPAQAAPAVKIVYGYAWADGKGHLRIVPKSAAYAKKRYRLKTISGAGELRLDYSRAAYRRVTVACDLKETEGRVALDARGLGRTACEPRHLADTLGRGPVPLRIAYRGGAAVAINEFLVSSWPRPRTAQGTIKRVNDTTLVFQTGGKKIKLGYTYTTAFHRVTKGCRDGWLTGRPVNADQNGLGRKLCTASDLTKVLRSVKYPVLAQVRYSAEVGGIDEVWEVFGDA